MKYKELSTNTVAFISYRCRLTKVLADAANESKGGGGGVRLLDVDIGRLLRLKYQHLITSLSLPHPNFPFLP